MFSLKPFTSGDFLSIKPSDGCLTGDLLSPPPHKRCTLRSIEVKHEGIYSIHIIKNTELFVTKMFYNLMS